MNTVRRQTQTLALACVAAGLAMPTAAQDAPAPVYKASHQIVGTIRIWGSPQMGDLLRNYEEGFRQLQPSVHFENDLKSTITAVAGVYTDRADIGLLGREIWPTEVQAFESIEGYPPMVIDVATGSYDVPKATFALMIFVPRSNPIARLSVAQLEQVFGSNGKARTWGDVGLKGAWAARPIHLYGFSVENDKSQIFSQLVFRKGERWNAGLHESANGTGPAGADAGELIVKALANDPDGIAISNMHYATPNVRAIPLSAAGQGEAIAPTGESVASRRYPLTRAVYMVLNSSEAHPPSAATMEFLRFVLSKQGQDAVLREGNYLPLTDEIAARQLRALTAQ